MASPEEVDNKPTTSQSCNTRIEYFVSGDFYLHQFLGPDQAIAPVLNDETSSKVSEETVRKAICQAANEKCGEKLLPVCKYVGDIRPPMYVDIEFTNSTRPAVAVSLASVFAEAERNAKKQSEMYGTTDEARENFVEQYKNVVMLIGSAGIGKTTALKHLGIKTMKKDFLPDVTFVFYIECKLIDLESKSNIYQFLFTESGCEDKIECSSGNFTAVLRTVIGASGAGCLILLDGLDELGLAVFDQVKNKRYDIKCEHTAAELIFCLLTGKFLKKAKKLCATRKQSAEVLSKRIPFPTALVSQGLKTENQNEIGREMCGDIWTEIETRLNQNADLREICKVPFVCVIVMHCMKLSFENEPGAANLRTLTGILIYAMECCANKLHENASNKSTFFNDLDEICKFAWLKFTNQNPVFENFKIRDSVKSTFMRSGQNKHGFKRTTEFYHLLWQHFFAALHAMTKLAVADFRKVFKLSKLKEADKETFTCFLFGLCNEANLDLSRYTTSIPAENCGWVERKEILGNRAIKAVKYAQNADSYDERLQSLFQLGRWLKEKNNDELNNDDLIRKVESHIPKLVTLADKIYPSDIRALMHLLKPDSTHRQVGVGIMSSPRFQGNSLLLLFSFASEIKKSFMSSVDLRGNKVDDDVAEQISRCVSKIDSINLTGTEITEKGTQLIWKNVALRKNPMEKFVIGDIKTRDETMSHSTLLTFIEAVLKIKEVCFSMNQIAEEDITKIVDAVGSSNSSITSIFLDHVLVSSTDIELLSKSLQKISDDLVVMYCGVDENGYQVLKKKYEERPQPNRLRIFLGDVEGVGSSVSLQ